LIVGTIVSALKTAGLIPGGLPAEIELAIATVIAETVTQVLEKHFADPAFAAKITTWSTQALTAQGGTNDDRAKVSAALVQLMGS
jgi:hypothetical protein